MIIDLIYLPISNFDLGGIRPLVKDIGKLDNLSKTLSTTNPKR